MRALNVRNMRNTRQSGFTIIELVVVILLLGILTATALPRFLDVTDEAHAAVIDATRSGLLTGGALFRAQWIAEGQPTANIGFGDGTIDATVTGYPAGIDGGNAVADSADCLAIYDGLLQTGRPVTTGGTSSNPTIVGDITGDGSYATSDLIVLNDNADVTLCEFYYVAQKVSGAAIPRIQYNSVTGAVLEVASGFTFP